MGPRHFFSSHRPRKFAPAADGAWEIRVFLKDGSVETIHRFDPHREVWRQFEFDGLTLDEVRARLK